MAIEPGWKITDKSAKNLARWDTVVSNDLKDTVKWLPELDKGKKLTIVDVGSNTGTFAELMLTETSYEFERILLFEPASLYIRWAAFKFSCLLNDPAIEIMQYALSDRRGVGTLGVEGKSSDFGRNTMVESWHKDYTSFLDVVTVPFDEIYETFQFVNGIDLIRINVQGHEVEVLNGMRETLKLLNNKPPIIVSITDGSKHHNMPNLETLLNNLKDLGYFFGVRGVGGEWLYIPLDDTEMWPAETFDLTLMIEA